MFWPVWAIFGSNTSLNDFGEKRRFGKFVVERNNIGIFRKNRPSEPTFTEKLNELDCWKRINLDDFLLNLTRVCLLKIKSASAEVLFYPWAITFRQPPGGPHFAAIRNCKIRLICKSTYAHGETKAIHKGLPHNLDFRQNVLLLTPVPFSKANKGILTIFPWNFCHFWHFTWHSRHFPWLFKTRHSPVFPNRGDFADTFLLTWARNSF